MYKLKNTSSTAELKDHFDQKFDTKNPLDHIHGALLALCNPGFDKPKTRDAIEKLVINLSTLRGAGFTNVVHLFQTGLAEGAIAFRPDTPIHANDERRYPGGTLRERGMQPRHFEFGAVGGGMRVVFDLEDLEIYISAHYSFPARLTADPRSAEGDWLLTTQNRLARECSIMEAHSNGETYKTRVEIDRLRGLIKDGKKVGEPAYDARIRGERDPDGAGAQAQRVAEQGLRGLAPRPGFAEQKGTDPGALRNLSGLTR